MIVDCQLQITEYRLLFTDKIRDQNISMKPSRDPIELNNNNIIEKGLYLKYFTLVEPFFWFARLYGGCLVVHHLLHSWLYEPNEGYLFYF